MNAGAGEVQVEDGGRPADKHSHSLSLSLSRLVSPDFYLDKLTEKVGPFDYILIFLWVSRTERYHNILILVILNINFTVISGPRPDLKASPHPQFGPSLENS